MHSGICRETPTLRKHWYLQWKTHIFSPRTHRGRMNMPLKNTVFFTWIQGRRFRQLFAHFGAWNVPKWQPKCATMTFKMNKKTWLNQHLVKRVPNRLQNTILGSPSGHKGLHFEHLGCPKWPKLNILGVKSDLSSTRRAPFWSSWGTKVCSRCHLVSSICLHVPM